ncbi:hypothetical protein MVEN_00458400 [Mycena venus]|uniref:Uncharacterized protein n=1 Tax=Mycena venus TaxID=2733690 RepID=A0A8H6YVT6_9AGAR|nr:hypothetical protein MVEN_00458400 [Mycena venus]
MDMTQDPWPKTVMHPFEIVPMRAHDTDFYGAYNKLLYHLFPADTNFLVLPGAYPRRNPPDSSVEFMVFYNDMPVLLLQVKSPDSLRWPSAREQADIENRRRLRDLRPLCPLPKLYAVSAFGTKTAVLRRRQKRRNRSTCLAVRSTGVRRHHPT